MPVTYGSDYGLPTLDLNFARNKSLIDTTTGRNLITFTRSQSNYRSTYVGSDGLIKYAAADEPRFDHDPTTGVCNGLLIEEQRTNLITYSEQFDNAVWNKVNVGVTTNATVAPDGTLTADLVTPNTSTLQHAIEYILTNSDTALSFSVYLKTNGYYRIALNERAQSGTSSTTINLLDGSGGSSNTTVTKLLNGWYRISWNTTYPAATPKRFNIVILPNTGSGENPNSYTWSADGTSGIFVWGAQVEAGSFATSYIPIPSNSTLTRTQETVSILGSNFSSFYSPNLGTIFCSFIVNGEDGSSNSGTLASFGTTNNDIFTRLITYDNRLTVGFLEPSGGNLSEYYNLVGKSLKVCTSFDNILVSSNPASTSINGNLIGGNHYSIVGTPVSYDRFGIGRAIRTSSNIYTINGTMSRLTYYPKRLPNYQLQALTR